MPALQPHLKLGMKDFVREPTPKERVREKHKNAFAREGLMSGDWYIYTAAGTEFKTLGRGETAVSAWADAAQRLT